MTRQRSTSVLDGAEGLFFVESGSLEPHAELYLDRSEKRGRDVGEGILGLTGDFASSVKSSHLKGLVSFAWARVPSFENEKEDDGEVA